MKMNTNMSDVLAMFKKDAVVAGYGIVSGTIRKAAQKIVGSKVGELGVNALSLVAGAGLSRVGNSHLNSIGSALRVGSIANVGNSLVESFVKGRKEDQDQS